MSETICQTTHHNIPEDFNLQHHLAEKFKSC